jgi:hypothetical protein
MPLTIRGHHVDPGDPNEPLRRFSAGDASTAGLAEPSPWVEPDYTTVARDDEMDGPGPYRNWPGPPLVMPAGLLPDGKPFGHDEMDNAARIEGVRPRTEAEADACVRAYMAQQRRLRREAGIAPGFRDAAGVHDTPEALAAIIELHRQERDRRRRRAS